MHIILKDWRHIRLKAATTNQVPENLVFEVQALS